MARRKEALAKCQGPEETNRWGIIVVIAAHLNLAIQECGGRSCDVLFLSWRDEFDSNAKETAAVQSIIMCAANFSNLIGGVLNKRFGCRFTGVVGGCLAIAGTFGGVWVRDISQLYVTAVIAGAGIGLTVNTALVVVTINFRKGYKTAIALAYAGCGTGKMAMPPLIQLLLISYGWRGAMLVVSAIAANIVLFATLFRPPRQQHKKAELAGTSRNGNLTEETDEDLSRRQLRSENGHDDVVDMESATEANSLGDLDLTLDSSSKLSEDRKPGRSEFPRTGPGDESKPKVSFIRKVSSELGLKVFRQSYRYSLLCPLALTASISYFGTPIFIIPRAESIGVAPSSAAFLLSMNGIGVLVGRIVSGLLISSKLSAEIVCSICTAVAAASLLLLNADNYACLSVGSLLLGFSTGVLFSVFLVLIRRYVGSRQFSVCIGFYFVCSGVGSLVGPLLAGWLFDITESYETIFYVQAGMYFICSIGMFLFPVLKRLEPGIGVEQ